MKRRVIFIQIGSDDNRVFIMTVVFSIDIDTHLSPYIYLSNVIPLFPRPNFKLDVEYCVSLLLLISFVLCPIREEILHACEP